MLLAPLFHSNSNPVPYSFLPPYSYYSWLQLDPKLCCHINLAFNFYRLTNIVLSWSCCGILRGNASPGLPAFFDKTLWIAWIGKPSASMSWLILAASHLTVTIYCPTNQNNIYTITVKQDLPVLVPVHVCQEAGCMCVVWTPYIRQFCERWTFFCLIGHFPMNSFLCVGAYWINVLREPRRNTINFLNFKVPEVTGFLPLSGWWQFLAYDSVKIASRCLRHHLQM